MPQRTSRAVCTVASGDVGVGVGAWKVGEERGLLMAAGRLPAPGTECGPCVKGCKHLDCQQTRDDSAAACAICGDPIGYETRFYRTPTGSTRPSTSVQLEHALCAELQEEGRND